MRLTKQAAWGCIAIAFAAMITAFSLDGFIVGIWIAAVLGLLWGLGIYHSWSWLTTLEISISFGLILFGAAVGFSTPLLYTSLVFCLAAWELDHYNQRMSAFAGDDSMVMLERKHLARLTLVSLTSLGIAWASTAIKLRLSFDWSLALGLIALVGLSQAIRVLRRAA